jgi:hypothetical protein
MSLWRFYQWVAAYCAQDLRCLHDRYFNYRADVPQSVYRVGRWSVYETASYGLFWGDEDPLDPDSHRPPGELQASIPNVDAEPTPLSMRMRLMLNQRIGSLESDWSVEGSALDLAARIETISACYVSVGIERSVYTGGAHSNGLFESFNWNRTADAPLNLAELFKPGIDWQQPVATLYVQHLRSGDAGINPSILEEQSFLTAESLKSGIDKDTLVTEHGLKIVVGGLAPAYGMILPGVELKWAELQPWLASSAPCAGESPQTN